MNRRTAPHARPSLATTRRLLAATLVALLLPGCAVVTVAGAAAGAAISVTGAVVSTGVKVTGKVVEKTIDAVTPGSD
ncbi:hypothetical protein [Aquabacterium sp. OR-4]|uniref:hypothetical protein n=1 Tax=Aquabacterium sp. OR-4 TaxID=2978127 RepID=UPI0021B2FD00|nr:hypothetical protein [Aquabacterium sp. OR-4]MDT7836382.1 hypothetical protein [Aquabacterium sp. OR-4]